MVCIVLPLRGITERPATGTLRRPVDISSRSESPDRATASNGVLPATTDRQFHQTPPWPAPFGPTLSSGAPSRLPSPHRWGTGRTQTTGHPGRALAPLRARRKGRAERQLRETHHLSLATPTFQPADPPHRRAQALRKHQPLRLRAALQRSHRAPATGASIGRVVTVPCH